MNVVYFPHTYQGPGLLTVGSLHLSGLPPNNSSILYVDDKIVEKDDQYKYPTKQKQPFRLITF